MRTKNVAAQVKSRKKKERELYAPRFLPLHSANIPNRKKNRWQIEIYAAPQTNQTASQLIK